MCSILSGETFRLTSRKFLSLKIRRTAKFMLFGIGGTWIVSFKIFAHLINQFDSSFFFIIIVISN